MKINLYTNGTSQIITIGQWLESLPDSEFNSVSQKLVTLEETVEQFNSDMETKGINASAKIVFEGDFYASQR